MTTLVCLNTPTLRPGTWNVETIDSATAGRIIATARRSDCLAWALTFRTTTEALERLSNVSIPRLWLRGSHAENARRSPWNCAIVVTVDRDARNLETIPVEALTFTKIERIE